MLLHASGRTLRNLDRILQAEQHTILAAGGSRLHRAVPCDSEYRVDEAAPLPRCEPYRLVVLRQSRRFLQM